MENHECSEANRLLRIEKMLDGNGKPGLIEDVVTLKEKFVNMEESLESLASSYSALAKSQLEVDITERLKIEQSNKRMKYLTIISIVFGVSIPLTALIIEIIIG